MTYQVEKDTRNVAERFKGWTNDLINADLRVNHNNFSVLMMQLTGDFNIGTIIRNGNSFGMTEFFYYGEKKKYDRRSCVGSYIYSAITHLKEFEQIVDLKNRYTFVGVEQASHSISLDKFNWKDCKLPPLLIIGEESCGLSETMINLCDFIVEIPSFGSVRSLNAGCASSIAMWDYIAKTKLNE